MNIKDIFIRYNVPEEDYAPHLETIEMALLGILDRLDRQFARYSRFQEDWDALTASDMLNPESARHLLSTLHSLKMEGAELLPYVEAARNAVFAHAWRHSQSSTQEARKQDATLATIPLLEIAKRLEGQLRALDDIWPYLQRLAFDGVRG